MPPYAQRRLFAVVVASVVGIQQGIRRIVVAVPARAWLITFTGIGIPVRIVEPFYIILAWIAHAFTSLVDCCTQDIKREQYFHPRPGWGVAFERVVMGALRRKKPKKTLESRDY